MLVPLAFAASAAAEEPTRERAGRRLDLELAYHHSRVSFDSNYTGLLSGFLAPRGVEDRAFGADGIAGSIRAHVPVETLRGTVYLQIGGFGSLQGAARGKGFEPGGFFVEGTRLEALGAVSVGAGLRWGVPLGPVEIGLRPYLGLSFDFYDAEVRARSFFFFPQLQHADTFAVTVGVLGGAVEIVPFPGKSGVYLFAGAGYGMPLAGDRHELADGQPASFSRARVIGGEVDLNPSWSLETGIGWRFHTSR